MMCAAAVAAERERIAAWLVARQALHELAIADTNAPGICTSRCGKCWLERLANAIRSGEHRGESGPPKAKPLTPEQVAKLRERKQQMFPCICTKGFKPYPSSRSDPRCMGCHAEEVLRELFDEYYQLVIDRGEYANTSEPVAAGGEDKS